MSKISSLIKPWPSEKQERTQTKIAKEALRVAARLGAKCCVVIAFYEQVEYYHMVDGGQAPMPTEELYRYLISCKDALKESDGEDVQLQ